MTSASGRVIGSRYRLVEPLGRGGMGIVWLAHDEVLDRAVALKEVVATAGASEDLRERLMREARAAARLDHPNAVRIYDVVDETDHAASPWIVMEVLTGKTLKDVVNTDGPLPPRRVAEIGLALVDALGAAHRAGIVHRDVKPANVQLCDDGRVVLTDFGIAAMAGDSSITRTGDIVGSPAYMSPERARGTRLGPESDLFALGATLYAAVEGTPPFERETAIATLTAIVSDPPAPCRRAGALAPVLDGLLAKDPTQRLSEQRTRELLASVATGADPAETSSWTPLGDTGDVTAAMPALHPGAGVAPGTRTGTTRRRRFGLVHLLALVVGLAAIGGVTGWLLTRSTGTSGGSKAPVSPGQDHIPADWKLQTAPDGWKVATPADWQEHPVGSTARFNRPSPYGYVSVLTESGTDASAALQSFERAFRGEHASYQRVSLDSTTFRGQQVPRLTATYQDSGADLEASWLAVPANGHVYLVWWQTFPANWDGSLALRSQLESTFRAPGQ